MYAVHTSRSSLEFASFYHQHRLHKNKNILMIYSQFITLVKNVIWNICFRICSRALFCEASFLFLSSLSIPPFNHYKFDLIVHLICSFTLPFQHKYTKIQCDFVWSWIRKKKKLWGSLSTHYNYKNIFFSELC